MKIDIINTDFDELPFRESRYQNLTRRYCNMYNLHKFEHRWSKYYKVKNWIIENNIGKSFDKAFSYYCSKIPKHWQYIFLKEFEPSFGRYSGELINDYIIDSEGKIRIHKKYDKIRFYKCKPKTREGIRIYQEKLKAEKRAKKRAKINSFKDWDALLRDNSIKCYNSIAEFKRKQQEEIKRQEELNTQKIIRHGFDPITSFRN
jgi:hypothetical protein